VSGFLETAFGAIGAAASSRLGLVAYALAIAAGVVVALRVQRNRHLLANLEKLPPDQRLRALELEMHGGSRLARGLRPEQFLRARLHTYYVVAFAVVCTTAVVLFVLARVTPREETTGAVAATVQPRQNAAVAPTAAEDPVPRADSSSGTTGAVPTVTRRAGSPPTESGARAATTPGRVGAGSPAGHPAARRAPTDSSIGPDDRAGRARPTDPQSDRRPEAARVPGRRDDAGRGPEAPSGRPAPRTRRAA
jgi:hypothetical protein